MQSVVDASTAECAPTGTKRAASPAVQPMGLCTSESPQPLPQHYPLSPIAQTCSCKRPRTSSQYPSLNAQNTPSAFARTPHSIIWHDNQNQEPKMPEEVRKIDHKASNIRDATSIMMTKTATTLNSTQDSSPRSGLTASASDERMRELRSLLKDEETLKAIENMKHPLRAADISKGESMNQLQEQLPTSALLQTGEMDAFTGHRNELTESRSATGNGLVGPPQRSLSHFPTGHSKIHNFYTKASILSPRGIFDFERVQVDERSSFNLLPWSAAKDLHLLLYPDKVSTITVADRLIQTNQYCRFIIRVAGVDAMINTMVIPGLQTVLLGQEWIQNVRLLSGFDNQSYYIPIPLAVEAADERLPEIRNADVEAQNVELFGTATTKETDEDCDDHECDSVDCRTNNSSDGELSSCGLPSGTERSLDGSLSGDELAPTDEDDEGGEYDEDEDEGEDDEDNEDYGDYGDYECEECKEAEDDTDANLQVFMKQHEHHEYYAGVQLSKAAHATAKLEPEPKRLTSFTCPKNESVGDPTFNISSQQLGPKGEQAFSNSYNIDSLRQSAAPNSTKPQMNEVQTPFTKLQAREIANTLNDISRTQAGQSFRAPVKQLWPECAEVYAVKVPNPIDLGIMEMKIKNNAYHSLDDFRADAILLYENSLAFNGIDHIVTSAALEVRDTILKAISDVDEGKGSTTLRASIRKS